MEFEHQRDRDERITAWTVVWVLFVFKMATVGLIWYAAQGSSDDAAADGLLAATTWYYAFIPIVAVSGFVGYRLRLRAARKRAEELRRAEFMSARAAEFSTMSATLSDEEKERLSALQQRRKDVA